MIAKFARFAKCVGPPIGNLTWLLILAGSHVAWAQPEGLGVASQLPVEVLEVVTGGTWSEGSASGAYRTVTVQNSANPDIAEVYLQWIGTRTATSPLQIISSVPLREFNDKKLGSSSVSLETGIDGSAHIGIAAEDNEGNPAIMTFEAHMPGHYELLPEPASAAAGPRP